MMPVPGIRPRCSGLTLPEVAITLAVLGTMAAGANAFLSARFGEKEKVRSEARGLVDDLLELRAQAVRGMRNPCLDFPDSVTVRLYSDTSSAPDGYHAGKDLLLRTRRYPGGIRATVEGGRGATRFVCFESRGIAGSAGATLQVTLRGQNPIYARRVRLLPATGMAKVL